jgi:DNA-directed RNA polymerase specialized sigma24 family protein
MLRGKILITFPELSPVPLHRLATNRSNVAVRIDFSYERSASVETMTEFERYANAETPHVEGVMLTVPSDGSITILIGGMRSGDDESAARIWRRFSPRAAALARKKLPIWLRRIVDDEDLANSALCSLLMGLREGRFPELRDRDDLWALLAFITVRKARNEIARASCQKRLPPGEIAPISDDIAATDLPPDLIARAADEFDALIDLLGKKDPILEPIALWKFEGYTSDEIAKRLGCSLSKVARKLELIKKTWAAEGIE